MPTKKSIKTKAPVRKRTSGRGLRSSGETISLVTAILQGYADKAIFRAFSPGPAQGGRASFAMLWHYDRRFELLLDVPQKTLHFPALLPGVDDALYTAFQEFLTSRHDPELPPHRRIDTAKARMTSQRQDGLVSVTMTSLDGDFEYATRKLIHIVHETFLAFLADGPYFEYLVEHLGLDPDRF